ncbi:MAG: DNA topoisomerase 4 subunit A [Myxococcales bacterium]|nr:DNA topoisomerase 4 subunit A [Myxococcales bacterium]
MPEAITDILLHETTRARYLNYALSVITSRALPDVRDGLKPVQRRILYAMFQNLRLLPDTKYRKSAAVVGEVMAKYHPHGDQSIYDAMVRMAQSFSLRYPLVDGQGNFGSLDGDGAAAMRYTEARLRHLAVELASELKKKTVDYRPTYDGTLFEPVVLPAQAPNLLINGATGIAVGMATSIPPHNLKEVVNAAIALIDNRELTLEQVVPRYIKGPDFPTAGELLNDRDSIRSIYETGRGSFEVRGQYNIEEEGRKKRIVITSVPYALNKSTLISEIADHIRTGKVPQLVDMRDESTEDIRIVLDLKRGANAEAAMAYLYKRTNLQSRFSTNLTALVPTTDPQMTRPERLDLVSVLRHFLDFRFEVTTRRLTFDLEQLLKRIHLLEGFEIVFDALDEAIRIIRASDGKGDARDKLMARFGLDWEQAEAILETKLYRLAKMEIDLIRAELAEKRAEAARLRALLADAAQLWALVRDELSELKEAYGDRRRTKVVGPVEMEDFSEEVYIIAEDAFVIVTRDGWLKRQKSYTDLSAIRVREGDSVGWVVPCSSRETVTLFGERGKAWTVRVADVPQTTGYGEVVSSRFDMKDGERIVGVATSDKRVWPKMNPGFLATISPDDPKPPYVMAFTRGGRCARVSLTAFTEPSTRSGRTYLRLNNKFALGDSVVGATLSDGEEVVSVVTRESRAACFAIGDVNVLSGAGKGVTGIKLSLGDFVMGFKLVHDRMDGVECVTNRGKTEIVRPNKYKPAARGGRGREIIKSGHIDRINWQSVELTFPDADEEAKRKTAETQVAEVQAPKILEDKPLPPAPEPDALGDIFGAPPADPAQLSRESGLKATDAPAGPPLRPSQPADGPALRPSSPRPPTPDSGPALRPSEPASGPPLRPSEPRRDPFKDEGRLGRLARRAIARTQKKKDKDDQGELF